MDKDKQEQPVQGAQSEPAKPEAAASEEAKTERPSVNVEALEAKIRAEMGKEFARGLKELTGAESLDALRESKLADEGKYQELLQAKDAELVQLKRQMDALTIRTAVTDAAGKLGFVDPADVYALVGTRAALNGETVSLDGKPVSDFLKELAASKPYLLAPSGGPGGGSPAVSGNSDADLAKQLEEAKKAGDVKAMLSIKSKLAGGDK